jgi:hypothetical protein
VGAGISEPVSFFMRDAVHAYIGISRTAASKDKASLTPHVPKAAQAHEYVAGGSRQAFAVRLQESLLLTT